MTTTTELIEALRLKAGDGSITSADGRLVAMMGTELGDRNDMANRLADLWNEWLDCGRPGRCDYCGEILDSNGDLVWCPACEDSPPPKRDHDEPTPATVERTTEASEALGCAACGSEDVVPDLADGKHCLAHGGDASAVHMVLLFGTEPVDAYRRAEDHEAKADLILSVERGDVFGAVERWTWKNKAEADAFMAGAALFRDDDEWLVIEDGRTAP